MTTRRTFGAWLALAGGLGAFQAPVEYVCPMDKDVRSKTPGKCPRCGMALVAGVREPVEYRLGLQVRPPNVPVGKPIEMRFELLDRNTGRRVGKYEEIHEKLFHLFVVSADLQFFIHDHPVATGDSRFRYRTTLPRPGIYRVLADCYPAGATPQLLPGYVTTGGYEKSISESIGVPPPDLVPQRAENLAVSLRMDPPEPSPGVKTMLFFTLNPGEGVEQYLGAWGHMLAVSHDLIDSVHEHPIYFKANSVGGAFEVQFDLFFPRAATYRVWIQFQRLGVVNTVAFTIPVRELR
jgi:hypothetical protein